MNTPPTPEPTPPRDPSKARGFAPELYPTANGGGLPAGVANESVVLEFLAAYYDINARATELQRIRQAPGYRSGSPAERAALQGLESALRRRDELEDRNAPCGVIAEPVMRDGITRDVRFTFGHINAAGNPRSQQIVSSAFLSIPLPPGVRVEDLTFPDADRPEKSPR
jgi:hypothetical protein